MSLQSWRQNSWLVEHATSPEEITNLLGLSDRDLAACQVKQLSADWRFAIAYNAGLQAATAALAAAGYRATRDNHHYRVIQSLEFTTAPDRGSSTLLMAFARNAISAAMISRGRCLTKKRARCSNSLSAFAGTWKDGSEQLVRNCLSLPSS